MLVQSAKGRSWRGGVSLAAASCCRLGSAAGHAVCRHIHPLLCLQGDDYILYCHPTSKQKTPSSIRLREWYHILLRRCKEAGVVTYLSNLWDTYFPGGKDHKLDKCSAMHLPYFEGAARGERGRLGEGQTTSPALGGKRAGLASFPCPPTHP